MLLIATLKMTTWPKDTPVVGDGNMNARAIGIRTAAIQCQCSCSAVPRDAVRIRLVSAP